MEAGVSAGVGAEGVAVTIDRLKCLPLISVIILIAILIAGCGTRSASAPAPITNAATPPLSDEECIAYAHKLEELIATGDAMGATAMVDWEAILDEGLAGLESKEKPTSFFKGMRVGTIESSPKNFQTVVDCLQQGGGYRFIRIRNSPEGKRVLFRLLASNEGGLNYHEILLGRRNEKCIGRDLYVFTSGEKQSQVVRRMAILGMPDSTPYLLQKLSGVESEQAKSSAGIIAMSKAMSSNRFADALAAYNQLPTSLQRAKPFLLIRLRAAQQISTEETLVAIDAFREAFPDDSAADLYLLHSLTLKQDFAATGKVVDRIERSVGGDPFLDVMRGQFLLQEKRFDDADAAAQKAIAVDSTLTSAWWLRVTAALNKGDFPRVVEMLKVLKSEHNQEPADFTDPLFSEFVKSPEYREWQAERSATP